jgi:thiol:disulfide interchange protein DsbA
MFWYGCPHCLHFEPIITAWAHKSSANVDFIRTPAIFRDTWEPLARAFYTAEALGVMDRLHDALFQAVQVQHRKLDNDDALRAFFAEQGVAQQDFDRTFRSFGVESRLRRAKDLTQRYGIDGVPSIIVDGKYRTNGTIAGGLEKVPAVIDTLIRKESETAVPSPKEAETPAPSAAPIQKKSETAAP